MPDFGLKQAILPFGTLFAYLISRNVGNNEKVNKKVRLQ